MKIAIEKIHIGVRRREALGDIPAMARSLRQYGLLHPIIIAGRTLVAGHRRIEAAKQLGWKEIEAQDRGELDERDLRALELEENIARKDLSGYEASKNWKDLARLRREQEAEEAAGQNGANSGPQVTEKRPHRGTGSKPEGRPKQEDSQRSEAEKMGVAKTTAKKHSRTLELGDKYPFMQTRWKQAEMLKAGKVLDALPEAPQFVAIFSEPGVTPKTAIRMLEAFSPLNQRSKANVMEMLQSDDIVTKTHARQILAGTALDYDSCLYKLGDIGDSLNRLVKEHSALPGHQHLERAAENVAMARADLLKIHKEKLKRYGKEIGIDLDQE